MASVVKVEGSDIIPAPFVSISVSQDRNKTARFTKVYNITLTGFVVDTTGGGSDEAEAPSSRLNGILGQQTSIENHFVDKEWVKLEVGNQEFQCRLLDISFGEGVYINHAPYTVNLIAYSRDATAEACGDGLASKIESFGEDYSVEQDNTYGENIKYYTVTRNVTAVGRENADVDDTSTGDPAGSCAAWYNAKTYLTSAGYDATSASAYPDGGLEAGLLELEGYASYKHRRSQAIDVAAGSYNISDTWLIGPSGNKHHESFTVNTSATTGGFTEVSIDGNIRGFDTTTDGTGSNADDNARTEWLSLSKDGDFGTACDLYTRANAATEHSMNSQPKSVSAAFNPDEGTVSYNISFDNRPVNIFDGVLTENITINDTYPGDVFSVIPIIGRGTGPILQGMGTRTEFTRSLSIEFVVDPSRLGYGDTRSDLLLTKPSLVAPFATELSRIVNDLSPSNESNVRKYFVNAPQETWNPKTGAYSLNCSWTYELSD